MARERQQATETDRRDGALEPERRRSEPAAVKPEPRGDGLKPERVQKKPAPGAGRRLGR